MDCCLGRFSSFPWVSLLRDIQHPELSCIFTRRELLPFTFVAPEVVKGRWIIDSLHPVCRHWRLMGTCGAKLWGHVASRTSITWRSLVGDLSYTCALLAWGWPICVFVFVMRRALMSTDWLCSSISNHTLSSYNGPDALSGESDTFPVLQNLIQE